jgi:hypothetical protein
MYHDNQGLEAFLLSTALAHGSLSQADGDYLVEAAMERTNFHLK